MFCEKYVSCHLHKEGMLTHRLIFHTMMECFVLCFRLTFTLAKLTSSAPPVVDEPALIHNASICLPVSLSLFALGRLKWCQVWDALLLAKLCLLMCVSGLCSGSNPDSVNLSGPRVETRLLSTVSCLNRFNPEHLLSASYFMMRAFDCRQRWIREKASFAA